jgi:hypothetical protein
VPFSNLAKDDDMEAEHTNDSTLLRKKVNQVLGLLGGSTAIHDKSTANPVWVERLDLKDTSEVYLLVDGGVS